jgi:soluble lytic murein transglycosylase
VIFISSKKLKKLKYLLLILVTAFIVMSTYNYRDDILKVFYPLKYSEYVFRYSQQYNIDPYLVFSVIRVESRFDINAYSKKGAKGLMQITDKTGEWAAKQSNIRNFNSEKLFDPEYNIRLGCWYLNNLVNQFGGDITLALAAYNGGSGNVEKWLKNREYSSTGEKLEKIPFEETERYIDKIKKDYSIYKNLYKE